VYIAPRTIYVAPGAILSMAEFTKHVKFLTFFYQPLTSKYEPSRNA